MLLSVCLRIRLDFGGSYMTTVSIHDTSTAQFIDRLHEAFLDGDEAAPTKVGEASNVHACRTNIGPLHAAISHRPSL